MILLKKEFVLHPQDTKTNITFDFDVAQDFSRAEIAFSYEPKWVTDPQTIQKLTLQGSIAYGLVQPETKEIPLEKCPEICNMVTISMDMNDKFCGYAHRHDWEQLIVISEEYATPGFYRMHPEKGVWHLVIPVCNVSTDECTVRVTVTGVEE